MKFLLRQTGEIPLLILPASSGSNSARYLALKNILAEKKEASAIENYIINTPNILWEEKNFNDQAFEFGYKATQEAFSRKNPPKALAYFTDNFALGGIAWCYENNIRIGKDIFLSGFNNIEAIRTSPFPVASAEHPVDDAIQILLQQMTENKSFNQSMELKLHLRPE